MSLYMLLISTRRKPVLDNTEEFRPVIPRKPTDDDTGSDVILIKQGDVSDEDPDDKLNRNEAPDDPSVIAR